MHGVGIYQFADGHRYEGGFKDGWMEGPGTVIFPCQALYQGYYSAGKMNGEGTRTAGGWMAGGGGLLWVDGVVCGAGTLVFDQGKGHKYEGLWKNGE